MSGQNGHLDFQVATVRSAQDKATVSASFRSLIKDISGPRWAKQVNAVRQAFATGGKDAAGAPKRSLPGILFSGTFEHRANDALLRHSGLICVDLDDLGDRLGSIREGIIADPHTLAAFVSPSGNGLKAVFRCNPGRPHVESFRAAERYMLEHFGLEIDQACKDVARICFVSHDPETFLAESAEVLPYPVERQEFKPAIQQPSGPGQTPGDDYDARGDLPALLIAHGWTKCGKHGWTRPDKTSGVSATFDAVPGRFYVFTSSTPFQPNHVYRPWHAYAILEHNGDFAAAARELGKKGYGAQGRPAMPHASGNAAMLEDEEEVPAGPIGRPLSSFQPVSRKDSSVLLGNRYLNRGDGAVIVSTSGMGKSALCLQTAATWALGRAAFGIQPNGPLRSLVIQSEDSDGDVAEVAASIRHSMQLSAAEFERAGEMVRIVTDRVNRGPRFIGSLQKAVQAFKPDLVWINPLQAFIDGDVTDSQDLGAFLREGLNSLNEPATFGYILIHHTTKPATGKDRAQRLWHEVMYDMAGGAEIINWARAVLSLRATEQEGNFNLVLAKRGRRAGVTKEVEQGAGTRLEPVTTIPLKHSSGRIDLPTGENIPLIFWEPRAPDVDKTATGTKAGRQERYAYESYRSVLPKKTDPGKPFNEILRLTATNGKIPQGSLQGVLKRWAEQGCVEIIIPETGATLYRSAI